MVLGQHDCCLALFQFTGQFKGIRQGDTAFCSRIIDRANFELARKVASAPSVPADASQGLTAEALLSAVKKEDAKVTVEIEPRLKVSSFMCELLPRARLHICLSGHFACESSGHLPTGS